MPCEVVHAPAIHLRLGLRRLASGDADGRVAVWDVLSGAVTGALEDPLGAATGRRTEPDRRTGVVALAWLRAAPALVGIAVAGGMFVLWDPSGARRFPADRLYLSHTVPEGMPPEQPYTRNCLDRVPQGQLPWCVRAIAAGGGVVWKKDLGGSGEGLASIQVDPLDRRVLCLAGTRGSLTVLKLVQPAKDR